MLVHISHPNLERKKDGRTRSFKEGGAGGKRNIRWQERKGISLIEGMRRKRTVTEHKLEVLESFYTLARCKNSDILELPVKGYLGKHALYDVGTVETVHTVGTDNGGLSTLDTALRSALDGVEVLLLLQSITDFVEKQQGTVPLETTALVVEVEVDVVETVHTLLFDSGLDLTETLRGLLRGLLALGRSRDKELDNLLVGGLDTLLTPLLVHKVDKVVVTVKRNLVIKVGSSCGHGSLNTTDLKLGCVVDVVHFRPENGDTSSGLDITEDLDLLVSVDRVLVISSNSSSRITNDHRLLSFVEVGCISGLVNTTCIVPSSSSVTRLSCNQHKGEGCVVQIGSRDLEESEDDR